MGECQYFYDVTGDNYLETLLGSMQFLPDGGTADPAIWEEWMEAVEKVKSGKFTKADVFLRFSSENETDSK
ncbi:MAG: hypothetical protein ROO73_02470 [Roseivirga sp.]